MGLAGYRVAVWVTECVVLGAALAACGAAAPPPPNAPTATATAPAVSPAAGEPARTPAAPEVETPPSAVAAADAPPLPTSCARDTSSSKKVCVPDQDFAKRACSEEFPEVALAFFGKGTPWTRAYLTRDVDAWNAGGGRTHRAKVAFDEEVIVLAHRRANPGGIVMLSSNGDSGTYDVLRFDGSCISVMSDEITTSRPPAPKHAPVTFRRLDEATRTALLAAPTIKNDFDALGKACAGPSAASGPSAETRCDHAEAVLTVAIADFVRTGHALPAPTRRP